MPDLTFRIPWNALCSKNAKYVGRFSKVLSPMYREAQKAIGDAAWAAAKKAKWTRTKKQCGVEVFITEPDHLVRDAYNYGECVLDGLTKMAKDAVWWDDCQARDVRCVMVGTDKANAGATVRIWILGDG